MDLDLKTVAEIEAEKAKKYSAFSGINLSHIRSNVSEALTHFGKFSMLEEYTKHDISHIDSMLNLYDWLIPRSTRQAMTPADWLLITLSTYLHDFGLIVTRDEFDQRENSGFPVYKGRVLDNQDSSHQDYRAQIAQMNPDEAERFLYQEFARHYHAQRIKSWLHDTPDHNYGYDPEVAQRLRSLLAEVDDTFREDIGTVCESHHLDDLGDVRKYPLSKPYGSSHSEEANVQYAAIMLRTADLLHITRDRVPSMAALVVNPRNPKSQIEWAKQAAVRSVRPQPTKPSSDESEQAPISETIEVHATFKEAEGFFGLTSYLQYAREQVSQSYAWARVSQTEYGSSYAFPWRRIDTTHIEAKGFVAEPFEFTIDQSKILDLLTGHTLYNDTGVVVRELVQNSLDAVRLYGFSNPVAKFIPKIVVKWDSESRVLEVHDNGIGMTQHVIESNFLRVGSSHYQDPEFKKVHPEFAPISRFGIGVLSAFMVADDVAVTTNHEDERQARQLNLRDVHGKYLVRLVEKQSGDVPEPVRQHGTIVRLKLRPSASLTDIHKILEHWIVVPGCDIRLSIDDGDEIAIGCSSVGDALERALKTSKLVRRVGDQLVGRFGHEVQIRSASKPGLDVAYAVEWSPWLQEWNFFRVSEEDSEGNSRSLVLGTCIAGIRVTDQAAGFRDGGIPAIANAHGRNAPRTNVARSDLERTEEYDDMLRAVYGVFADHVVREMRELETDRASSLTRAALEASYMTRELTDRRISIPESAELLQDTLRSIPAIVIEENGTRSRQSVLDLRRFESLATLESQTVLSLESVMSSIRGARSASLKKVLEAIEVTGALRLPEEPILCSLSSFSYYHSLFLSEWEVSALTASDDKRLLTASWQKKASGAPGWISVESSSVPRRLANLAEHELPFLRRGVGRPVFLQAGDVVIQGFDESLVATQGRLFVLKSNSLHKIAKTSPDVEDDQRNWLVGFILDYLLRYDSVRNRSAFGSGEIMRRELLQELKKRLVSVLESASAFDLVTQASVEVALNEFDLDVLDVMRWDRREDMAVG